MKTGVLFINLGTPDAPRTREVRNFLREFLSDPDVIDLPALPRWLLVNLVILPRRPRHSAQAYAAIWTDAGSPLLVHSRALVAEIAPLLENYTVALAMRYGTPSIADGLAELRASGCERVIVMPEFPQYSESTTGSILKRVRAESVETWDPANMTVVPAFYAEAGFLDAFAEVGRPILEQRKFDHVLFSFHGLPESHILDADNSGSHCLKRDDCCAEVKDINRSCYRAQCFASARGIAERLMLDQDSWSVSFQSRLGRAKWLEPYTDRVVVELARKGVKRLAVYCPSFVADCLETLEEIGLRADKDFCAAGGEALHMIPSLNASRSWAEALAVLVRRADANWSPIHTEASG